MPEFRIQKQNLSQNQSRVEHCDYLIIGGGSAGSILARRLADADIGSVILLEAGNTDEGDPAILDLSLLDQQRPVTDWGFLASPISGQSQQIKYSRARMLGGCGGHNDCAFLVPPDCDFATWDTLGAKGWSASEVEPYFRRVESMVNVVRNPSVSPVSEAFLQAGHELGLKRVDFRTNIAPGVGVFPLNITGKYRQSASVAYLHPVDRLPGNLRIECSTRANKLLFKNNIALGCITGNCQYRAKREVILACGAIQTPQLMMVSGIGPGDHLMNLGIHPVLDIPGVGEHLVDHAAANLVLELENRIPDWHLTPCETTMLMQVDDNQPAPDLLFHFVLTLRDKYSEAVTHYSGINGVKLSPNVARPRSQGTLKLKSPDFQDQPSINLNYFSDPDNYDMRTIIKGLRFARQFAETLAFENICASEVFPGPGINTDDEFEQYVRQTCETVYHPAGTCRMGDTNDPVTVVDPELRVKGIPNLRVCDASIFPSMVTVNINNTVMMVAEKAADMIISECRKH